MYLLQHIEASLGSKIKGLLDKTDSGVLYTDSYVARYVFMHMRRMKDYREAKHHLYLSGPVVYTVV